jgi:predicted metal-dependent phosphoesterase TrpH
MAVVDLHLHTTASDGRLTPARLISLAAEKGLKTIAVTDHDSTEGLKEAFEAARAFPRLSVIPGAELSTDIPGDEIHVLAYFFRYEDVQVQEVLQRFRAGRLGRAMKMVEKLGELGVEIEWERVQEIAGDASVGRPHIAQAMVEKGYIREPWEAFDLYINRNGPAYVEREKLTPREAVSLIVDWGGAAVLAHPSEIANLDDTLEDLKDAGLSGMEVYYSRYSIERIQELADIAARHGMIPCGGSDYHASGNTGEPLPGTMGPPLDTVERLREVAAKRSLGAI